MKKSEAPADNAKKKSVRAIKEQIEAEQRKAKQLNAVAPARAAAFRILLEVENEKKHSDDLLRCRAVDRLTAPDRNLATALVLGVLRWQILLDAQLRQFLKHPNAKLDTEVRIALRMGAFQLQHMDRIPARAAIDESVELTKKSGHRFASGMVNAVLRKFSALPRATTEDASLSAHPAWMVERWTSFYGEEVARQICLHGQRQPRVALRLPNAPLELNELMLLPGELLTQARVVRAGETTDALEESSARIQDEGSQLVAELAALSADASTQKIILDCCAAPGGKTLILAERNPQAKIIACEINESRCKELSKRLAALGERVEVRCADATQLPEKEEYDLILVDAPCSGTGTLGRNPEIRHRITAEELLRQAERQQAILKAALGALRPGGRLIYSTCSLEPEENEQVIAAVLSALPQTHLVSLAEPLQALHTAGVLTDAGATLLQSALTPEGFLKLLPGTLPTDGFFIAQITRENAR